MTDTTDIKALREKFETLSQIGDFYYFAKDLLDQLEAERQRAESVDARIVELEKGEKYWFKEFKQAEAELAALKGDQVPVGVYNQHLFNLEGSAVLFSINKSVESGFVSESGDLTRNHAYLFTAPQKPVVLPMPFDINVAGERVDWKGGDYYDRDDVLAAIEAAGGIVENGE